MTPKPLIDSELLPPRAAEEALADPDTRVYALQSEGFDYQSVPNSADTEALTDDQKDNLRFLTNPVQRLVQIPDNAFPTYQFPDNVHEKETLEKRLNQKTSPARDD